MTTKDGIITSATENELYRLYVRRGYDMAMSFSEYLMRMSIAGVKIEGWKTDDN